MPHYDWTYWTLAPPKKAASRAPLRPGAIQPESRTARDGAPGMALRVRTKRCFQDPPSYSFCTPKRVALMCFIWTTHLQQISDFFWEMVIRADVWHGLFPTIRAAAWCFPFEQTKIRRPRPVNLMKMRPDIPAKTLTSGLRCLREHAYEALGSLLNLDVQSMPQQQLDFELFAQIIDWFGWPKKPGWCLPLLHSLLKFMCHSVL